MWQRSVLYSNGDKEAISAAAIFKAKSLLENLVKALMLKSEPLLS